MFGNFPINIAGKTGSAEKNVTLPGDKYPQNLTQSWWCGYGPYESPTITVCAVIENGGHGGTAAAPAALRVFEKYFKKTATTTQHASRLMSIEAVDTRARGLRNRRETEALGLGGMLRRLDWVLMFALVGVVGYGLSAIDGITKHDIGGSAASRQGLYAAAGALLFVVVLFIDPDNYRRLRRPIYFGTLGLMVFVLAAGAATRGSHRWINVGFFTFQPSEFGKVLFVLVVAGFLADRARTITSAAHGRSPRSATGSCRSRSSSCSPTSAPRSSTWRRSRQCSSSPACAGRISQCCSR